MPESCDCEDCQESDTPCMGNCDPGSDSECRGCIEARIADSEAEFEFKKGQGIA